jgi:acetyltransferase-like isoleucine patch superfamily enzyme
VATELKNSSPMDHIGFYVNGQAAGWVDYVVQGLVTTVLSGIPGLLGIALRSMGYRLIMRLEGIPAIESHVRVRHARNIRLGHAAYLDYGVYLHATPGGIQVGRNTCIMHNTELHVFNFRDLPHAFIDIGRDTFVGESVVVRGQGGVSIGNSVLIGPRAKILAVNHNFGDLSRPIIEQGITARGIVIEDGAWIGGGAVVLDGVRVGRGAVVGANAVVTRDVAPHTVVVGTPARVVKDLSADQARARTHPLPAQLCLNHTETASGRSHRQSV